MSASVASNLLEIIMAKLRGLDASGSCTLEDGTVLLRKLPPRPDVDRLETSIQLTLPADLRSFYRQANGLDLFSGSLSIRGLRDGYSRQTSIRLPTSLRYGNVIDKPNGQLEGPANQVRFGFFSDDPGAELAMNLDGDRSVYAYPRYKLAPVLFRWSNLQTFLLSEVDRMISVFRARNADVDPLNPIAPPWEI